jgi:hypothetical protein
VDDDNDAVQAQGQISAAAHRLSGESETLVVGVCSVPVV